MKAKIESAVFSHEFGGQDGKSPVRVFNVVAGGVAYQCWQPTILSKIGSEVEFESIPPKPGTTFPPRMKMIEAGQSGGFGGKRPFVPSWKDSREGAMFSARTFAASYAKDVVCAMLNSAQLKPENAYIELMKGFKQILPLFELEKLQEPAPAQPEHHPTCKNLTTMLHEIKLIPNMQIFSKWWGDNQGSIKALSAGDKQILFSEKSQKTAEIENQEIGPLDSSAIPF